MRYDAIRRRCAQDISADLSKLFLDVIRSLNRTLTSKSRQSQIYLLSDLFICRRPCPVDARSPDIFAPFFTDGIGIGCIRNRERGQRRAHPYGDQIQ